MLHQSEYSAKFLLQQGVKEMPKLWEPYLPQVGLGCVAGASDTGKSAFLRQLALCVACGRSEFLGTPLRPSRRSVIYVSTEDDELATAYLLNKQNDELKIPIEELERLTFFFDTMNLLQSLDNKLTESPADLVIIDCFTDLYYGSINESNQVRTFLNAYSQLAQKHQCLILFLHHCGKRTEDLVPSKHSLLGSQAFEAKMRVVLELRKDLADLTCKHLCCTKGNYLSEKDKSESMKLYFSPNLVFQNTGEHVPFENLIKSAKEDKEKYERIQQKRSQGYKLDDIAKEVGYKGKSGVSHFVKRYLTKYGGDDLLPQLDETPF
jgi:archaellum biogenesis ATPase FlaH